MLRINSQFSPVRFSSVVLAEAEREQAFRSPAGVGSYRQSHRKDSFPQP